MTFEAVMDQGAYFEFKRHRMMTQTVQSLTANLGFAIPRGITESGCEEQYSEAMHHAQDLYHRLAAWNPDVASYVVPNGFNRRVLFDMNLREAFHFCRLRAAENAHFSIRRVSYQVVECIREIYPILGGYLDVPPSETSQSIEEGYFTNLQAF
jgi:thymidylate synthase ThyX